jgi:hypothetical protein
MRFGSSFAAASARACAAILVALPLALPIAGCGGNKADSTDPVKLSFVVMGCNRIQESDWEKTRTENPSSANLPQLRQTLADIAALIRYHPTSSSRETLSSIRHRTMAPHLGGS